MKSFFFHQTILTGSQPMALLQERHLMMHRDDMCEKTMSLEIPFARKAKAKEFKKEKIKYFWGPSPDRAHHILRCKERR